MCKAPLDFMRPYPFVMPATKPVGFSNDFLASVPGHAVLAQMLEALPRWRMPLLTKYPTVMFSTGPMFVTLQVGPAWQRLISVQPLHLYFQPRV